MQGWGKARDGHGQTEKQKSSLGRLCIVVLYPKEFIGQWSLGAPETPQGRGNRKAGILQAAWVLKATDQFQTRGREKSRMHFRKTDCVWRMDKRTFSLKGEDLLRNNDSGPRRKLWRPELRQPRESRKGRPESRASRQSTQKGVPGMISGR